ncbi:MAG: site-2 protease family protein [Bryobacteraceae bacterium]
MPEAFASGPKPTSETASGTGGSFRLLGVPIRLHFTFVILVIFLIAIGIGGGVSAWASVLYILALFLSVLLHELGHVAVSKHYGIKTIEIVMYPIGGLAKLERNPKPREEFWIALAGPAVNLVIAGGILGYLFATSRVDSFDRLLVPSDANLAERIAIGNLILAGFNMIPAFPMDGGRVLRAALARFKPEEEATRTAAAAGRFLAIAMGLFGLLNGFPMLIFIALFVYLGAAQESAASMGRTLTQGIPVRSAMITDYRTLAHGDSIREAANLLLSTSQQDFPVVLGEQVIGLLGRNALLRGMAIEGPESYVAGVMDRQYAVVSPDMDLAEAIPVLAKAGSCALVMEGEELLGLLTRENLSEFLMLRRFGLEAK